MENGVIFPVSLKKIYAEDGGEIRGHKALMREDKHVLLSVVSDQYQVITHEEVITKAMDLFSSIGVPSLTVNLSSLGKTMMAVAQYKEIAASVGVNDAIGMQVIIENSYNKRKGVAMHIGGLVLSCSNGMVGSIPISSVSSKHTISDKLLLPTIDDVMKSWEKQTGQWQSYGGMYLSDAEVENLTIKDLGGVLPIKDRQKIHRGFLVEAKRRARGWCVWDLHQAITAWITHTPCGRLTQIGKINRLRKVSAAFNKFIFGRKR